MAIPLAPTLKNSYLILVGLGGLYVASLCLLTLPWLQREALYANRASTAGWWHNLSEPEQFGFLDGQVQEARISTPDGESLYGWHVLPIEACSGPETELLASQQTLKPTDLNNLEEEYTSSRAFEIFRTDPKAKLIINFHGNAGHVAQGWRTDTYHALVAADPKHAHVFAFDYRGFGYSTGNPTEEGLIRDGTTVVRWFLRHVPPSRIVLVGNSLGVAVSIATAEKLQREDGVELAGLVLVAGFSDLPKLLTTYAVFHAVPVFSPLKPYPRVHQFFERRIVDTWDNVGRLYNYVRAAGTANIALIHARNDYDIPWSHSMALFYAAANATSNEGMTVQEIDAAKHKIPLKRGGFTNEWRAGGEGSSMKRIRQTLLRDGGHNRIMTFPWVTKAVIEMFA